VSRSGLTPKLRRAISDPRSVLWERVPAERLFRRYGRLARQAGLDRLYLVLSFDCDTLDDAEVAAELCDRLAGLGVTAASFAVPGEILEQGADIYSAIAARGIEFLNHGQRVHTVKRDGRYESTLFYDRLSREEVRRDVTMGGETVLRIAGHAATGFRVPHFGTYQRPSQLRFLHRLLTDLGYAYSSSTVPLWGFRCGPAFRRFGVLEFPLSGTADRPLDILDSWGFFAAPGRDHDAEDYRREGADVAELYRRYAGAGILSFYADPSQVQGEDAFFDTVTCWREIAEPATYGQLATILRRDR
jgi:Polysaccharide deacetylase